MKRILAKIVVVSLFINLFSISYADKESDLDLKAAYYYNDVSEDAWYFESVNSLSLKGYIKGYPNGDFKPDNNITREEMAEISYRVANAPYIEIEKDGVTSHTTSLYPSKPMFKDVEEGRWSYEAIRFLNDASIVKGRTEDEFFPEALLTREEAAVMADRILSMRMVPLMEVEDAGIYKDDADISDWAKNSVKDLARNGIITGYEDGTFRPKENITRAELTEIMSKVLKSIEKNIEKVPEIKSLTQEFEAEDVKYVWIQFNDGVDFKTEDPKEIEDIYNYLSDTDIKSQKEYTSEDISPGSIRYSISFELNLKGESGYTIDVLNGGSVIKYDKLIELEKELDDDFINKIYELGTRVE